MINHPAEESTQEIEPLLTVEDLAAIGRADEESQSKTVDTGQTTMGTREASVFLNLPHQRLMQLIDEGKITSHKTDEGVRIQVSELAGFKQSQNEASTAAMDQLTALSEELKLGY